MHGKRKHTLSCTVSSKIAVTGVGEQYRGLAGRRSGRRLEKVVTYYMMYTKEQDKTTPGRVGKDTSERLTAAWERALGPNIQHAFMSQARINQPKRSEPPYCTKEYNMQDVTAAHALAEAGTWLFWRTTQWSGCCGFNTPECTTRTMLPNPFSLDEILLHALS